MRIGVIGCGYLGSRHARKLGSRPDVGALLLHDAVPERARMLADEIPGAVAVPSVARLIEEAGLVVVAASTEAHAELTIAAARAGRHVLVEKPIASTLAEADRMILEAKEAGTVLAVGQVERFNPVVSELSGRLTAPKFIEAHRLAAFQPRSLDIDVVLDLMIHDIDLVLHFTRELPSRIDAAGASVLTGRIDIANARLAFPGGCVANLTASRVSLSRTRKIRLFMPETYVSIDLGERRAERYRLKPAPGGTPLEKLSESAFLTRLEHESITGQGDALEAEEDAFIRAARGEAPVGVPGKEGRAALAVALQIVSRLEEQKT